MKNGALFAPIRYVTGKDRYVLLCAFIIIDYLSLTIVNSPRWNGITHVLPIIVTVLLGFSASGVKRRTLGILSVILLLTLIGITAQALLNKSNPGGFGYVLVTILLLLTQFVILRRTLTHKNVTLDTLFGAIDVYILIGITFANVFLAIASAEQSLHLGSFLSQTGTHPNSDYVYLSFETLTTLGFGDLTPHTLLARSVVVLEALVGQIFLVTLVARMVSLYGIEQMRSFTSHSSK